MYKSRIVIWFLLALLLSGCKAQLYTGLAEREGNDMLALLLNADIKASKELDKDRHLTLFVPHDDVARSIHLLRSNGYPHDNFSSVSDIFPKDGLISSPIEERARYTYSMSQELSATLSMIDGVVTARVHVVLPQGSGAGQESPYPSSAAVFIKYSPDLLLSGFIPKVKTLVSNSIEGLSLDKITVTLFPSGSISASSGTNYVDEGNLDNVLGIEVSTSSKKRMILLLGGLGVILLFALGIVGFFVWMFFRKKKRDVSEYEAVGTVTEDGSQV